MALQIRRGSEQERIAGGGVVFAEGELIYVTDTNALYIGDGATAGGVLLTNNAFAVVGSYLEADTINQKLKLNENLDLNSNDIIGTGNINIAGNINATGNIIAGGNIDIGDAPGDTVTINAQVDSSITPETDTAYDLGSVTKRWRNIYANGATIDGQIDAVAINADLRAADSTLSFDNNTGNFTGNLTGDVTGNLTGNVSGNVTGNADGDHVGTFNGTVGDVTPGAITGTVITANTNFAGPLTGDVTGNVNGNLTGDVKGTSGTSIISPNTGPADAEISVLNITATGNITGNVIGNTSGVHTGRVDGDVNGSIFADNSTLLVDAVSGTIPNATITLGNALDAQTNNINNVGVLNSTTINATTVNGTTVNATSVVSQTLRGDLKGTVSGDDSTILVDGTSSSLFGNTISTAELVITESSITAPTLDRSIDIYTGESSNPGTILPGILNIHAETWAHSLNLFNDETTYGIKIGNDNNTVDSLFIFGHYAGASSSSATGQAINFVRSGALISDEDGTYGVLSDGDEIATLSFNGFDTDETYAKAAAVVVSVDGTVASGQVPGKIALKAADSSGTLADRLNVSATVVESFVPFKFPVVADDTARTALVPTPEKGMVILMEAGTTPAATNQLQFFDGSNWTNV